MIVFYLMLGAILAARAAGTLGLQALDDWAVATRVGLAVMFVFTGIAHFTKTRDDLMRMVPPTLPRPGVLVTLTGLAELLGAIGLLIPATARWAACALAVLLVVMFPANIYAARIGHTIGGRAHTPMVLRLPLQMLWIVLLIWSMPSH
ncbi:MAG: DoxX family membrane protein [Acidobacteriota bacterium]